MRSARAAIVAALTLAAALAATSTAAVADSVVPPDVATTVPPPTITTTKTAKVTFYGGYSLSFSLAGTLNGPESGSLNYSGLYTCGDGRSAPITITNYPVSSTTEADLTNTSDYGSATISPTATSASTWIAGWFYNACDRQDDYYELRVEMTTEQPVPIAAGMGTSTKLDNRGSATGTFCWDIGDYPDLVPPVCTTLTSGPSAAEVTSTTGL